MSVTILDGRAAREALIPGLVKKISDLGHVPLLAIIQVGDRPDSTAFIRAKQSFAKKIGVAEKHIHIPVTATQEEVMSAVQALNADDSIHGIIVQLPLPSHIDGDAVIETIDPRKDTDCLTSTNLKAAADTSTLVQPATARGIRELLMFYKIPLLRKTVAVVGRSKLVGAPIAEMCKKEGATVLVAHKGTEDVKSLTREADVIIVATGSPLLISTDHVKAGQVIIDVGITRTADSGIVGDVDFPTVKDIVSAISPVPGGVGPMTVFALFENLVDLSCLNSRQPIR
jgi:methylenetetrahydrofolate dehydrogenase (NADP+)/methenyltetrahydrofolate cyclohydrolase